MKLGNLRNGPGLEPDEPLTPTQAHELSRAIAEQMLKMLNVDDFKTNALTRIIEAEGEQDSLRARNKIEGAKVMATLALIDKIEEATATLKEVAIRQIDTSLEVVAKLREVA